MPKINRFWAVILAVLGIYAFIKWGIPAISREITSLPFPLPVPGALMFMYMVLILVAFFLAVTFSDEHMNEFLSPIRKFLRGDYGKLPRMLGLIALPLVAAWQMYEITVPKVQLPVSLRIQHPSSNFPKKFEDMKNPLDKPTDAQINEFIGQAKANKVSFIPQLEQDIERWMEEKDPDHMLSFIGGETIAKFLSQLGSGKVDKETAKAALREKNLVEGRALYAMNCRACHGDSVSGDGPMADGFKLRPINFTDNGTLETIVVGYTFWRVANGGPGLPTEATPWDSAMPEWKLSLTEEQRWKIILAEYDLAQKTPRIPEAH